MKRAIAFLITIACSCFLYAEPSDLNLRALSDAISGIARRALPAVVHIETEERSVVPMSSGLPALWSHPLVRDFFDLPPLREREFRFYGQGSGFLVSPDGYILTNRHVVDEAQKVVVRLDDGREFDATVVGSDPATDIALVKIDATDLPYLSLGSSDEVERGQFVVAIGSPFGLGGTLTHGVISAIKRDDISSRSIVDYIQTDAAINPGNSGGPLLNLDGEVIGINSAMISGSTRTSAGIGLAIPSNTARHAMDQLMTKGKVTRGYLGVSFQPLSRELAALFDLPEAKGVVVTDIAKESPAERAGLATEDVIVKLNGEPIATAAEFRNRLAMLLPDDPLALGVLRNGERLDLHAVLGERPGIAVKATDLARHIGIEVAELTKNLKRRLGYESLKGVVVSRVRFDSPAELAGIEPGTLIQSIDRVDISTPADFAEQLERSGGRGKPIVLKVRFGDQTRFVTMKLY